MIRMWLLAAFLSVAMHTGAAQERKSQISKDLLKRGSSATYDQIAGREGNGPAAGTVAPDFVLEPLKDYTFNINGSAQSKNNPIRLSDFKGDRPVVLIFGSYT